MQRHNGKGVRKFQEGRSGGVGNPRSIQARDHELTEKRWKLKERIEESRHTDSTSDQPISQGTSFSAKVSFL
jgi:hypothetical protein